jgi:probable addiction module antidote protein
MTWRRQAKAVSAENIVQPVGSPGFQPMLRGALQTFLHAGRNLAEAYGGMAVVARDAGITREALYRALSPTGNPTLKTLLAIFHAMDMRLSVTTGRTQDLTRPQGNTCRPA